MRQDLATVFGAKTPNAHYRVEDLHFDPTFHHYLTIVALVILGWEGSLEIPKMHIC